MCLGLVALLLVLALAASNSSAAVTVPDAESVLETLRPGHPRLIPTDEALQELRSRVDTDPVAAGYLDGLRERGQEIMTEPPVERVLTGSGGMLQVSFGAASRIPTLALLYQLDGDRR